MEIDHKKTILKYLIDRVFMPQVNIELQKFLQEYDKVIEYKIYYKEATGYNIGNENPIILNLDVPLNILMNNILISFGDENKNEKSV